eukprot:m.415984 g.415984  ORF g.415984 m.415984 type:complete len:88 (-) comp29775_c0_seq1:137-400(-)
MVLFDLDQIVAVKNLENCHLLLVFSFDLGDPAAHGFTSIRGSDRPVVLGLAIAPSDSKVSQTLIIMQHGPCLTHPAHALRPSLMRAS